MYEKCSSNSSLSKVNAAAAVAVVDEDLTRMSSKLESHYNSPQRFY